MRMPAQSAGTDTGGLPESYLCASCFPGFRDEASWKTNYDTVFMVIILSVVSLFILLVYNVTKIGWSLVHLFEPLDVRTMLWAMLVCVLVLFLCLIGFAEDFQNRLTNSYVVGIT